MLAALTNTKLMNGIKKASPFGQTSALEGFHSVLNQFSPKMIGYSYRGTFCRYECIDSMTVTMIIVYFVSIYLIEKSVFKISLKCCRNLHRQNRMRNGVEQLHVVYPKFKNGEAVVRNVKVQQNIWYIYHSFFILQHCLISRQIPICSS